MATPPKTTRLAVLFDVENLSVASATPLLMRLQSPKVVTLKRAYGDWSNMGLKHWKAALGKYGIQPMQATSYHTGKNSADMLLTIDAVDLLYRQINWFCIVSNDSDFTPLVHRLTSSGAKVIGFGSHRVSPAFANACHKFIFLESMFIPSTAITSNGQRESEAALDLTLNSGTLQTRLSTTQLMYCLQAVYTSFAPPNVWVDLGIFGTMLRRHYPGFSHKVFGYSALSKLIVAEASQIFEIREKPDSANNANHQPILQIRLKSAAT